MKLYWKILICIATFFVATTGFSLLLNHGTTDMTTSMPEATLPTVYFMKNGREINPMYGNLTDIDSRKVFDGITYLGEGRSLSIKIRKHDCKIEGVRYEIRTLDGGRLIEDTELDTYQETKELITKMFSIKDLIEPGQDYSFILIITLKDGREVKYYGRIATEQDESVDEKLEFVFDFSDKTFSKETSLDLVTYVESDSTGDNTNYSHVNIHSSLDQISWGDLVVEKVTEPVAYIDEMGRSTGQIRLKYLAKIRDGRIDKFYNIMECYRVRLGAERMYLLDFERSMNQLFFEEDGGVYGDKIMLGITDAELETVESADGRTLAFVQENVLFVVNSTDNFLARAFGFYDADHMDDRSLNRNHAIKILSIDEAGNVTFMVYGYMNRGFHEGLTGINVFTFSSATNTLDERIFIPVDMPFAMMKADLDQLTHLNGSGILILYLQGNIYSVNLENKTSEIVVSHVIYKNFKVSEDNNIIAWLEGEDEYHSASIIMRNLSTGKTFRLNVGADEWVRALGFMGEDLIYGVANREDVYEQSYGESLFPMKEIRIQNESGGLLKSYSQEESYVTDLSIEDNMITLERVEKTESGEFKGIVSDTILSNAKAEQNVFNNKEVVSTEKSKKIVQLVLRHEMKNKTIKNMLPKFILFEGERQITLKEAEETEYYYAYYRGNVIFKSNTPADAIKKAYEENATVVDENGEYIWKKGNLLPKNQIMAITGRKETEECSSLAVCLETIALFEGYSIHVQPKLDSGMNAVEVLEETLPNARVMDLTGCPMDALLPYVNRDIPVLAIDNQGNGILLIGFNDLNTVWMNPETGKIYKVGMNDSRDYFRENGNRFITYIRN